MSEDCVFTWAGQTQWYRSKPFLYEGWEFSTERLRGAWWVVVSWNSLNPLIWTSWKDIWKLSTWKLCQFSGMNVLTCPHDRPPKHTCVFVSSTTFLNTLGTGLPTGDSDLVYPQNELIFLPTSWFLICPRSQLVAPPSTAAQTGSQDIILGSCIFLTSPPPSPPLIQSITRPHLRQVSLSIPKATTIISVT